MLDAVESLRVNATSPYEHGCGSRWICCQTHPQAELWAAANLSRQGFRPYVPMLAVTRRDRVLPTLTRRISVPMFRSYVFVELADDHWAPIRHTQGISRVLTCNGKPSIVARATVEAVRAAEALAAVRQQQETSQWAPGAPCSLATGAFYGLPAVVTAVAGSQAVIAIMMLGQLRSLSVPTDCLTTRGE